MSLLISIALLLIVLWASLRFLPAGVEGHMPIPYMIALTHFLWVPSVVCAVLAFVSEHWLFTGLSLLVLFGILSFDIPYYRHMRASEGKQRKTSCETQRETLHETSSETSPGAHIPPISRPSHSAAEDTETPIIHVMTLNCRYGHADADAIVKAVQSKSVTALALQELSDSLVHRLEASGLKRLLPFQQLGTIRDTDNGGFNGIWTSLPVENSSANSVEIPAADVPSLSVSIPASAGVQQVSHDPLRTDDGNVQHRPITPDRLNHQAHEGFSAPTKQHTITFASAHTKSPMRGCRQWSQGIRALRNLLNRKSTDERNSPNNMTVVMGDLNANLHHPSFRELLRSGFKDASIEQGTGPILTFPSTVRWPRLELDHILFSGTGLTVSGVESFMIPDTDHLALTATLHIE